MCYHGAVVSLPPLGRAGAISRGVSGANVLHSLEALLTGVLWGGIWRQFLGLWKALRRLNQLVDAEYI